MMGKQLPRLLAGLAAFLLLAGLGLVRLWAVLGGYFPGKALAVLSAVLALLALGFVWRFHLACRFLTPWQEGWKNALLFAAAFVPGALLDTSYAMFSSGGLLIGALPFRVLCAGGSGLVFGCIVLAVASAARRWGRLDCPCGRTMLILALAVNVIAALYSAGSATVYYWDGTIYWNAAADLAAQPLGLALLRQVAESVITMEYNYLLALPISLVMRLLGTGRYVYLFAITNLYVLPALWGLCVLGRRARYGGVLLFLAAPMLLYTGLVGFADVAAAGAGIWAMAIYTDRERPAEARGILAGVLLVLTFLLRRYFFFFAVTFGAAALAATLLFRRRQWRDFLCLFAAAAVSSLFFAQSFLVKQVLSVNYGDLYSAYDQGRRVDWMMLTRYYGLILLCAALVLGIWLLIRRSALRWTAALALMQPVLCFFLFTRVQSHGQQHLLLYLPALVLLLACALEALPAWKPLRLGAALLVLCTAGSTLIPRPQPASPQEIAAPALLPSFTYASPQRGDIAQLVALRSYVDGLSAQAPRTAAVVSSSFVFNSSIYENIYRSMGIPEPDMPETAIIYMTAVDKRDAFSWNVLTADYLLVGDPVQTHLGEENQQVVALLAHAVLEQEGVGTAFQPNGVSFHLDDGVTIRVYERVRTVKAEEYRAISQALIDRYPDYAAQYQPPAWTMEGA